jgi:nitrite reductase/ring-hydroxylating ferredoxin subunit
MAPTKRLDWMHLSEIVEGQINVRVLPNGKKVLVLREGRSVSVFSEMCPHLGADLADGSYCPKEGTLQCKWHGYVFSTSDGTFLRNPNEGMMKALRVPSAHFTPERTPRYRLGTIRFELEGDRVYFLGAEEGAA